MFIMAEAMRAWLWVHEHQEREKQWRHRDSRGTSSFIITKTISHSTKRMAISMGRVYLSIGSSDSCEVWPQTRSSPKLLWDGIRHRLRYACKRKNWDADWSETVQHLRILHWVLLKSSSMEVSRLMQMELGILPTIPKNQSTLGRRALKLTQIGTECRTTVNKLALRLYCLTFWRGILERFVGLTPEEAAETDFEIDDKDWVLDRYWV